MPPWKAGTNNEVLLVIGGVAYAGPQAWIFDGSTWSPSQAVFVPDVWLGSMATAGSAPVLFGGTVDNNTLYPLADTWMLRGAGWERLALDSAPTARVATTMATRRGTIVLFGGLDEHQATLGDTWMFDGTAWTQSSPTAAPPARAYGALAPLGDSLLLFGGVGQNGSVLGDTWTFDGTTWSEVAAPLAPPPRWGASMAALGGRVVMFGGGDASDGIDDGGNVLGDTWVFDGATWTEQSASGPVARVLSTLGTIGQEVVLFGGCGNLADCGRNSLGDTWTFDGARWSQIVLFPFDSHHMQDIPFSESGASMTSLP
jgi:hypothetical protein